MDIQLALTAMPRKGANKKKALAANRKGCCLSNEL
jgi:hypothetical protein